MIREVRSRIAGNGGTYRYELLVEHDVRQPERARVLREALRHDASCPGEFDKGEVMLHRDSGEKALPYRADWSFSGIGTIVAGFLKLVHTCLISRTASDSDGSTGAASRTFELKLGASRSCSGTMGRARPECSRYRGARALAGTVVPSRSSSWRVG